MVYDKLGLAEYEAIEGFVKWKGETTQVVPGVQTVMTSTRRPVMRSVASSGKAPG